MARSSSSAKGPDPEAHVFYPDVYGEALVYELDSVEQPVRQWNGSGTAVDTSAEKGFEAQG